VFDCSHHDQALEHWPVKTVRTQGILIQDLGHALEELTLVMDPSTSEILQIHAYQVRRADSPCSRLRVPVSTSESKAQVQVMQERVNSRASPSPQRVIPGNPAVRIDPDWGVDGGDVELGVAKLALDEMLELDVRDTDRLIDVDVGLTWLVVVTPLDVRVVPAVDPGWQYSQDDIVRLGEKLPTGIVDGGGTRRVRGRKVRRERHGGDGCRRRLITVANREGWPKVARIAEHYGSKSLSASLEENRRISVRYIA
jgi:hypothetical protein